MVGKDVPPKIGPFQPLRILGSGGMGTVYEAIQENPRRKVALKILREGIADGETVKRFQYESRILARLSHPGIAQIYQAGTFEREEKSVPYFAMEYIENALPITQYSLEKNLSLEEKLVLFGRILEAVQHGHQKGVVHRDLKPDNLLVDGNGHPRIIDFGVARTTDPDRTITMPGNLIGTVQYMSPEQVDARQVDIDIRSDVYSLGIILYELLANRLPYDIRRSPLVAAVDTILRVPHQKLSLASSRLRGDLETIVDKSLEKDRSRRYQSTAELRQDLENFRTGRPISARPPSVTYQLKVFARRHKALAATTASIALALCWATAFSTAQFFSAEAAREEALVSLDIAETRTEEAERAQTQAQRAKRAESQQRERAEKERDRAVAAENLSAKRRAEVETTNHFLETMLTAVQPDHAQGEEVTVQEVLDAAARKIERDTETSPLLRASLHHTIGNCYQSLGNYETAAGHLEQALALRTAHFGPEAPATLKSKGSLGDNLRFRQRYDLARQALLETLEGQRRVLGDDDLDTLTTVNSLALLHHDQAQYPEAERLYRKALDTCRSVHGEESPLALLVANNLASLHLDRLRYLEAEESLRTLLETRRRVSGETHPETITCLNNLGLVLRHQGKIEEALPYYREATEKAKLVWGLDHANTIAALGGLAYVTRNEYGLEKSEETLRDVLARGERVLGPDHAQTLHLKNNLIHVLLERDETEEARKLCLEMVESRRRGQGDLHPDTLTSIIHFGTFLKAEGNFAEFENLLAELIDIRTEKLGPSHRDTLQARFQLANLFEERGDSASAEKLYEEVIVLGQNALPKTDWIVPAMTANWGSCLFGQKRYAEAETKFLQAYEDLAEIQGPGGEITRNIAERLVLLYETWGKTTRASRWRKKLSAQDRASGGHH